IVYYVKSCNMSIKGNLKLCSRYVTTLNQGYCLNVAYGNQVSPVLSIRKDAPSVTQLSTTSQTLNPGDSIGLQVIGTAIKAYYKSGGGVWTVVSALNTTDSSYSGSGR